MVVPKRLKEEENKDKKINRVDERYKQFLKTVNGTENLTFEGEHMQAVTRGINSILNDPNLNKNNKKILNAYHLNLANCMSSIDSRKSYLGYVKILAVTLNKDLDKITKLDLQNFFFNLEKQGLKGRSIFNSKLYIRAFLKWLHKIPQNARPEEMPELIRWMVFKKDKTIRTPDEVLTIEEVKRLAQIADNPRDSAIILTLFETGARCQEFLRLKITSVTFDKYGAIIKVPIGKSQHYNTYRNLRLISSVPALKRWIEVHPMRDKPDAYLWITLGSYLGKPLGTDGLKRLIKVIARRADVPLKKAYPHSFRHARCYDLISKGFVDKDLRILFGWSNQSIMPTVYSGAYGTKDVEYRLLKQAGLLTEEETNGKEDILKPKKCPYCGEMNSPTAKFCKRETCNYILDEQFAMQVDKQREESDEIMTKILEKISEKNKQLVLEAINELKLKEKIEKI